MSPRPAPAPQKPRTVAAGSRRAAASVAPAQRADERWTIEALQRSVGNQVVQRMVQRVLDGPHKELNEDEPPLQRALDRAIQRVVTPSFPVDRPAPKRSNTDASITRVKGQSYTGKVVEDKASGTYSYELTSFESRGEIQLVYYTEDHYPAPVPDDDTGALSNVNRGNWKAVADNLHAHRTGIADKWSAYRAEPMHENYHWSVEWVRSLIPELDKAETKLKALRVPSAGANAVDDTKAQADPIVADAIKEAKRKYGALGDSPGDPPYVAQAPAIDVLEKRVRDEAVAQKW
jgi:hypothetical protein